MSKRGRCFNGALGGASLHESRHAALGIRLFNQLARTADQFACQCLDVIRAAQGIDDIGDAALVLQDELGIARNAARKPGWQRDSFVKAIGVQALRATKRCG